ncbi:dolichyl-diphosphooligosaccharide--protein glycosyltransferase subunit 1 [Tulasnella sp. 427]|nr:dolichyl-diphosphooligosaccharide--protein glycosyltransferase subunit 1 [Tulasnella sp. 427]
MLLPRLPSSWTALTCIAVLLVPSGLSATSPNPAAFENSAVVRSIELGGATTQITTSYTVRSLKNKNAVYVFALSNDDASNTSWIEAKLKGSNTPLELKRSSDADEPIAFYELSLPQPLKVNETATFILTTVQSHASEPLPGSVRQTEPQALAYETGVYVLSPYDTLIQRIKLKSSTPDVISFIETSELDKFAEPGNKAVVKTGGTVTYGPFRNIRNSATEAFVKDEQQLVGVHYMYDNPVITIPELRRSAEISHWGSNLNIEDKVWLKNDGAKLKGHFARIEHLRQQVQPQTAQPHILKQVVFNLPSNVRDPYFYDTIGNVSTSRFRPASTKKIAGKKSSPLEKLSFLELRPRYPLMGGWNYTFTLGYDMPLEDWASYDAAQGAYVAAVPFLTAVPGAAYDDVEVKVVLPEGASIVDVNPPFDTTIEYQRHYTFLDTIGRPTITFKSKNLTDKHAGLIYITYKVDFRAHLQKPLAVAGGFLGLFLIATTFRRLDFRIHTNKKKQA